MHNKHINKDRENFIYKRSEAAVPKLTHTKHQKPEDFLHGV